MSEANGVLRNHYHPTGVTIYIEKRLTNQSYRLFSQPLLLLYRLPVGAGNDEMGAGNDAMGADNDEMGADNDSAVH